MAVRTLEIYRSAELSAHLVHYAARLFQPEHEHARAQVSFLLLGDLGERVGRREADVFRPAAGIKPAGVRHAASFGRCGAIMLALDFADDALSRDLAGSEPCRWLPIESSASLLLSAVLEDGTPPLTRDMLWDLVPSARTASGEERPVPTWVRRVREQIDDEPNVAIGSLAESYGVHRVHLSRSFQRAYGLPPSLYRLRCMASRAVSAALEPKASLADAAAASGFSDQSHMTRTLRTLTGLQPTRLRALLREATSVQDDKGAGS